MMVSILLNDVGYVSIFELTPFWLQRMRNLRTSSSSVVGYNNHVVTCSGGNQNQKDTKFFHHLLSLAHFARTRNTRLCYTVKRQRKLVDCLFFFLNFHKTYCTS